MATPPRGPCLVDVEPHSLPVISVGDPLVPVTQQYWSQNAMSVFPYWDNCV